MLFALFLGAGNIIFPPSLGQMAGSELVVALLGFLITGVGLPLIAILAIANASGGLQTIAKRVNPIFGIVFTMIVYLAIGPFFGIPRTATVSYEMAMLPFLTSEQADANWPLISFTIVFFAVTVLLALNPAKLVDRIGKFLTPILVIVIGALAIKSFVTPMGTIGKSQGEYIEHPFFRSFVEGYLTMDVIAALVFGIVIINTLKVEGVVESRAVMKAMAFAGAVAAVGLTLVYISLGFIGATSVDTIGVHSNGATVLALSSNVLYGTYGSIILGITIIFACLTTAIGLVSACAQFFNEIIPKVSYKLFVVLFATFSGIIANFGLTKLINISLPVLMMLYPLAIVLMLLSFIDKWFGRRPIVYIFALIATASVSIFDGLLEAKIDITSVTSILSYLPFYEQKIGWILPAIVATLIGMALSPLTKSKI